MKQNNQSLMEAIVIVLHETTGIGWQTIRKVVQHGAWNQYAEYGPTDWQHQFGMKPEQASAAVAALRRVAEENPKEAARRRGIALLTPFQEAYPKLLRHIPQPPWVLYAMGRTDLLEGPGIAIVGTRGPTAYGRRTALDLSKALASRGLTVVSGMARGIDAYAHEGAIGEAGSTIAVLGTPVDVVYPPQNRGLYAELTERGLVLSEVPPGTPFHPGHFPLRNRIIAGMSVGTLVIEAAERSGSLITATQALDMSRDVFAVPGPISSPKSAGTNRLIRECGAKLVTEAAHIIEEFPWMDILHAQSAKHRPDRQAESSPQADMSVEEANIYRLLQDQARTTDELHEASGYPFGLLHAILINLTIKRKIEQHPGSLYSVT
ncbi:DNA-processing protein DprA [Paenibacillus xanthanilyticus]|uniref:DNA-processing protein DprA n=1 Tax=Paenibacillus xanthanilyticus TaxID=1783531 RepID=A0ABV8KC08_9BACL